MDLGFTNSTVFAGIGLFIMISSALFIIYMYLFIKLIVLKHYFF